MQNNKVKNLNSGWMWTSWLLRVQAWPRIWTRDDREQIQLAVRVGFELRASRCKSSTLTAWPYMVPPYGILVHLKYAASTHYYIWV